VKSLRDALDVAERLVFGALITTVNALLALFDLNRTQNSHESFMRDR
jgi:hypothetical protein